ncbi:MAG: hypothetical protein LBI01_05790, partial [Elusimicrobium sp.]|nr:hypothetical protein [Elusimicrobium sp.]
MIKIVKNLTFTVVLLLVAVTAALCGSQLSVSSYQACRCKQSSPSTGNDNELCCSSLALGNSVYSIYTASSCCNGKYGGYGTSDGDIRCCTSGYWVAAQTACWTLCSSVTCSGTTPDKNGQTYKETTGSCCQAAT